MWYTVGWNWKHTFLWRLCFLTKTLLASLLVLNFFFVSLTSLIFDIWNCRASSRYMTLLTVQIVHFKKSQEMIHYWKTTIIWQFFSDFDFFSGMLLHSRRICLVWWAILPSKTASGEVGVWLPWWCPALVLPAPGYWGHFLNLIIFL